MHAEEAARGELHLSPQRSVEAPRQKDGAHGEAEAVPPLRQEKGQQHRNGQGQDLSRLARRAQDVADPHERRRQQADAGRQRGIAPPEGAAATSPRAGVRQAHERESERDLHPVVEHDGSDQRVEGTADDTACADAGVVRGELRGGGRRRASSV